MMRYVRQGDTLYAIPNAYLLVPEQCKAILAVEIIQALDGKHLTGRAAHGRSCRVSAMPVSDASRWIGS